jgi:hypothetical protein
MILQSHSTLAENSRHYYKTQLLSGYKKSTERHSAEETKWALFLTYTETMYKFTPRKIKSSARLRAENNNAIQSFA